MGKRITIAIQRKGRLFENSKNLLIKSGINFTTNGEKLLAKSAGTWNTELFGRESKRLTYLPTKGV